MDVTISSLLGDGDGRSVVDAYIEQVSQSAAEGFTCLWTAQMPWEPDLLSVQALALRAVPDIELGAAVLPIQVAHPMLTAQRALTLSAISGGRFKLGLGVNHPSFSEDLWGTPWEKPVRRMSEYLDGLLPLLAGEEADATGQLVTTRGSLKISGVAAPQVYIAAMGPQMLRLAGLVSVRSDGRRRIYRIEPTKLAEIDEWLEPYKQAWASRLSALEEQLVKKS